MKKHNDLLIVLAAGMGTRMGRFNQVPKHLLPYSGKAVISHIIGDSFPSHTRVLVVVSRTDELTESYLQLAFPDRDIEFVATNNPHPGNPLFDLQAALKDLRHTGPVYVTVADGVYTLPKTLNANCVFVGERDVELDHHYTMVDVFGDDKFVSAVREKRAVSNKSVPWIGVARFNSKAILARAVNGVTADSTVCTFADLFKFMLKEETHLHAVHTPHWVDLGDEKLYKERARPSDWEKPDRLTYFDGLTVIKYFADKTDAHNFWLKSTKLPVSSIPFTTHAGHFTSYKYIDGTSAYENLSCRGLKNLLDNMQAQMWSTGAFHMEGKTLDRNNWSWVLEKLQYRVEAFEGQYDLSGDGLTGIIVNGVVISKTWTELIENFKKFNHKFSLEYIHGDLTLDNMVVCPYIHPDDEEVTLIDWRPKTCFDEISLGDVYYDLGKLYLSLQIDLHELKTLGPTIVDHREVVEIGFPTNSRLELMRTVFKNWCKLNQYDTRTIEAYSVLHMAAMTGCHQGAFPRAFYFASLAKAHALLKI